MKNFYEKGITVIELLVLVAAIGLIVLIVLPQFSKLKENQVLKSAVADTLSSINKARGKTLSSFNSSEYGVHFQSDKVIIFTGKVFSAVAGDNETIDLTLPATISAITLTGGAADIYFNRLSGAPSVTGTITISTTSYSKIITISATGVASVN
ncbi:hypothetical protein A3A05_01695 [Candidatus Nomurabacteria bacterium RIFCSPLOWO2_01_FULL_41_12]|uniref:General secretion pathway GspH domain-containing protein n=1 Tax=Candidatus Nomurabacteria bacterium RIFCSPLOWO2_01_FULL_41_12 TaxID=1801774 RepID=A0A1F6WUS4_9BACT|nr:MAG: hypothetical protein A2732_00945 [Candidatus Nomurabacteria bacterium RIFCSPHIGHO2_01_FULL_40_10]OGI85618.1 MAG: hypothetical protein A3A05_01695 [Candidatus Nomurabacteria bacterium RIFCSPLOWO2_01_FULL_41_12]